MIKFDWTFLYVLYISLFDSSPLALILVVK